MRKKISLPGRTGQLPGGGVEYLQNKPSAKKWTVDDWMDVALVKLIIQKKVILSPAVGAPLACDW